MFEITIQIILVTTFPLSVVASITKEKSAHNDDSDEGEICGTIKTFSGNTLTLRENIPISAKEFEIVHVAKMNRAVISPVRERECAVNLCGFSSSGTLEKAGYIGTSEDYGDCELFQSVTTAEKPAYVANFNTSSLSCGCIKKEEDCTYTCDIRSSQLKWKENDCAVLFPEKFCNSCYFPPVYLSNAQNISTNRSLHFLSMVVRDGCFVEQRAPAFTRMSRFYQVAQPIIHLKQKDPVSEFLTSFLDDPESYRCLCGVPPPNVPIPPTPSGGARWWMVALEIGGATCLIVVIAVTVGCLIWTRKRAAGAPDIIPDNEIFMTLKVEFRNVCSVGSLVSRNAFRIVERNGMNVSLGHGRFGAVFQGILKRESQAGLSETVDVAIKMMQWSCRASETIARSFLREIKTFQRITGGHDNIVRYFGACCHEDGLFLFTEFCDGGSLDNHLKNNLRPQIHKRLPEMFMNCNDGYFVDGLGNGGELLSANTEPILTNDELHELFRFCEEIACGMEFLAGNGIIHLDLAPRNVLRKGRTVKICDFGLSKGFCAQSLLIGDFPCNSFAPELVHSKGPPSFTVYVDIWAYSCTVWEIFTLGDLLYSDAMEMGKLGFHEVARLLSVGYRHPKPMFASDEVYAILLKCWKEIPQQRPDFTSLRNFFQEKRLELEGLSIPAPAADELLDLL